MSGYLLLLSCFVESSERNANSVDPDQTPRSVASDLGPPLFANALYGTLGLNGLNRATHDITYLLTQVILSAQAHVWLYRRAVRSGSDHVHA